MCKDATLFFRLLKNAVPDENSILSLDIDKRIARMMGVNTFHCETGHAVILIRDEYVTLWEKILSMSKKQCEDTNHAVVTGTSGIGKSVFRWYLAWKWMNEGLDIDFRDIRVNSGKSFFIVDKDGVALQVFSQFQLLRDACASLALLDPCLLVEEKDFAFSMVIVTSSPCCFVGQVGKVSLSEFMKHAIIYVMKLWTLDEYKKVKPNFDQGLMSKFSKQEGMKTYCVPRWLNCDADAISGHLSCCWTNVSKSALVDFFLKSRGDVHQSKDLPYRLCTIVEDGPNNWKVSGFISEYAANLVYNWAEIAANLTRENFVSLLEHPLGSGLIGNWFERWALDCIAAKIPIIVSSQASSTALTEFSFNALETVDVGLPSSKTNVKPDVNMVHGILYHPNCKIFPSIDAFGIAVSGELILLQFTKALNHSPARWKDIQKIVMQGRQKKVKQVILVYCSPFVDKFRTPMCPTLQDVKVCKGGVWSDFYVQLKKGGRK